jgi:pSer/pThr/pTyr-binding forkhead associated (FHA) protein
MSTLLFEVIEGPDAGLQRQITEPLVIGRDESADVRLNDGQVSRKHARIWPDERVVHIDDLGSMNGTFLNGQSLHGPAIVTAQDEILIGVSVLKIRTQEDVTRRGSVVLTVPPPLAAPARRPSYTDGARPATGEGRPAQAGAAELHALLDARTKRMASVAPMTLVVLFALALILYFGLR